MKKVLIFCAGCQDIQEILQAETAIEQYKAGNEVHILLCDRNIGGCTEQGFSSSLCRLCKFLKSQSLKCILPKDVKLHTVNELLTEDIIKESKKKFNYKTLEELRNLKYKGVEIGGGAMSTYVSFTRNLEPLIDDASRVYFDNLLRSEVVLTLVIEKLQKDLQFDCFILFNGRIATNKPVLNIAQREGIEYICTEYQKDKNDGFTKNFYINDIPHNIGPNHQKFLEAWSEAKEKGIDRESVGRSFFERRRNAQGTGDKIYTAGQDKSKFVDNWDNEKENIVIFNSSEDEFFSVSGDFEKGKVFPSQIEGIKAIVEHYKDDATKHFYLRVHPNLMNVSYSYHLDLYKLDYPNLTVIPADSPISSYALLDKADKILTFGSTMGIEATYARKPSISLGPTIYDMLDVVYKPESLEMLWSYINNKDLKDLYSDNVLIYGYFYMGVFDSIISNPIQNVDLRKVSYKIFGKEISCYAYNKVGGSNLLFILLRFFKSKIKGSCLPLKERNTH